MTAGLQNIHIQVLSQRKAKQNIHVHVLSQRKANSAVSDPEVEILGVLDKMQNAKKKKKKNKIKNKKNNSSFILTCLFSLLACFTQ